MDRVAHLAPRSSPRPHEQFLASGQYDADGGGSPILKMTYGVFALCGGSKTGVPHVLPGSFPYLSRVGGRIVVRLPRRCVNSYLESEL